MKVTTFLSISILFPLLAFGQGVELPLSASQIVSPTTFNTPEVSSLGKFAMNPPNYSNGLPQQHIELLSLDENGISFPLSLDYSYSGWRPRERPGAAGVGWSISEGVITRVVKGVPDGNAYKNFDEFDFYNLGDDDILEYTAYTTPKYYNITANRILNKIYDAAPDEYIYNFNGHHGRFYWINNEAILFPHNDLTIVKTEDMYGTYFKITTPDGIDYTFKSMDEVYGQFHWNYDLDGYTSDNFADACNQTTIEVSSDNTYTTCWRLTKAENRNSSAKIEFEYDHYLETKYNDGQEINSRTFMLYGASDATFPYNYVTPNYDEHPSYVWTDNYYLKKIISEHYVCDYIYKSRTDYAVAPAMDKIRLFNSSDLVTPIKTIDFGTVYFNYTGTGFPPSTFTGNALKLRDVTLNGLGESKKYSFSYLDGWAAYDDSYKSCSIDHWGYANGKPNNTLIPKPDYVATGEAAGAFDHVPGYEFLPWADRTPNFTYSIRHALNEITYPTGGKSEITYESAGGRGIRVKSIKDVDLYGAPTVEKFYTYLPADTIPYPTYFTNSYSNSLNFACWPEVASDVGEGEGDGNLIRWYRTDFFTLTSTGYTGLAYYDETINFYTTVKENLGSETGLFGRNEYDFVRDPFTNLPSLTEKRLYNSSNVLVSKTTNTYETTLLRAVNFYLNADLIQPGNILPCAYPVETPCDAEDPLFFYTLSPVTGCTVLRGQTKINWQKLTETNEFQYLGTNTITGKTKFTYLNVGSTAVKPKYSFPNTVEKYQSNGEIVRSRSYYPGDINPDISSPLTYLGPPQMWTDVAANYKNMLSFPIMEKKFLNGSLVEQSNKTYTFNSSANEVNLTKIQILTRGENTKTIDNNYAPHNLMQQTSEDGKTVAILRDYGQKESVAKVMNSTVAQIAYSSFEGSYTSAVDDVNKGNWDFTSTSIISSTDVPTGTRYYRMGSSGGVGPTSFIQSKNVLTSGTKYILSFWIPDPTISSTFPLIYNGTALLSAAVLKKASNGWGFYELLVTGANQKIKLVLPTPSGTTSVTNKIDEVRLYPEYASMKTYTYNRSSDITSECDESNDITRYQYDSAGRLISVIDEDGKILNQNTYQYQSAD